MIDIDLLYVYVYVQLIHLCAQKDSREDPVQ